MDLETSTRAGIDATVDSRKICLGAAMRRAAATPAPSGTVTAEAVADSGKIRLGAAMCIPGRRHR